MKSVLFLRIAAALTFIHAVLHTIGGVFGKPDPGIPTMVAATMRGYRFPVFGVMRSYADFYMGMGLAVTTFLTVEAIVFWQLASLAKTDGARLRPILATFAVGYLAFALNSYTFFFILPVITELLIAACLVAAIYTARSSEIAHPDHVPLNATNS